MPKFIETQIEKGKSYYSTTYNKVVEVISEVQPNFKVKISFYNEGDLVIAEVFASNLLTKEEYEYFKAKEII